mgnify:CR=1 FL=1
MAQHDYVIDNSTGANVRADINSALQAIATNNSGSSAPSTTVASQFFADTNAGIMKLRNTSNNGFVNLFTLAGGVDVDAASNFNEDVTFTGASANIVFDKSDSCLEFADNAKAKFGAGDDLQIYHDGSNSFIKDTGTGNLWIYGNDFRVASANGNENIIRGTENGAVKLFFDNSEKLATHTNGIHLSGSIYVPDGEIIGFGNASNPDLRIFHDGNNSFIENDGTGSLFIRGGSSPIDIRAVDGEKSIEINAHSSVDLYHDGGLRFKTASAGLEFHNLTAGSGNSDLRYNTSNGAVFFDTSTILVKTNIENVPYGLDTLNKLQPRIYERTDCNNEVELGFIAEEVIKLIPEIVPTGRKSIYTKNESDTEIIPVNVDYRKLTVVLTKAVQELASKVAALEAA